MSGGGNATAKTDLNYPATPPDFAEYWWSVSGAGDPSSNPGGWNLDGIDGGIYDNGINWADDYVYSGGAPGNFAIARFSYLGVYTGWSPVEVFV